MYIKEITQQHRRDFTAIYICEHCGHEETIFNGYDDTHYHKNVIPKIKCAKCGEQADETYKPRPTKYPAGMQV